ncbi:MAG TPA: hypothetical protein PK431_09270 [Chitinophagales bacterium]|nr:hypothetical protein [Chitinophagales bacterium]
MSAEILNTIPTSGSYIEKHYGDSFKRSLWIKFIKDDFTEWVGCFGKGESNFDKVLINELNQFALIISGGRGYFIDINTKAEKLFIKDYPQIDSAIHLSQTDEFVFSNFLSINIIDKNHGLVEIEPSFGVDGIYLIEEQDNKVIGHLYSYTFSTNHNVGFEMNLTTREIIRDTKRLYDYNTFERISVKEKVKTKIKFIDKLRQIFR